MGMSTSSSYILSLSPASPLLVSLLLLHGAALPPADAPMDYVYI